MYLDLRMDELCDHFGLDRRELKPDPRAARFCSFADE